MPERRSPRGLRLIALLVAFLPWRMLRAGGAVLGVLVGALLRIRRRQVEAAVERAGLSPRSVAPAMYASLGTALLEFLWMSGRRETWLAGQVRLTARAESALDRAAGGERRAMVVATAHTGNWDLVACAAGRALLPLAVLTKHLRVGALDGFWQRERRAQGIELVDGEGFFARAIAALGEGRSVAVLIDQAPERVTNVMDVWFLGARARCDRTAALLAARAKVPLILALGRRLADGTHLVDVPLVLDPPERASKAWIDDATNALQHALEQFIRAYPSQWLWLHRRWKGPPIQNDPSAFAGTAAGRRPGDSLSVPANEASS